MYIVCILPYVTIEVARRAFSVTMSVAEETLVESYILATYPLQFSGLFPFTYDARLRKFKLSWKLLTITSVQVLVYIYVNASLVLEDWRNYAQPVASRSSLAVVGNLLLRLLGVMSTLMVLLPSLLGSRRIVSIVNHLLRLVEDFVELGIDTHRLYRQIRFLSLTSCVVLILWIILNCWHAVHFYELLSGKQATLSYYLVVALSDFYRLMFIFFMRVILALYYLTSQQINALMLELVKAEEWLYKRRYKLGQI